MVSPIPVAKEPPRTAFVFIDLVPSLKIQSGWNFWGERCFSYTGLFIEEGGYGNIFFMTGKRRMRYQTLSFNV